MAAPGRRFPLIPRKKKSDKSNFGHALIVAGSPRMFGAAVLAATSALRGGAGLVTLAAPEGITDALRKKMPPEIMLLPLARTYSGAIAVRALLVVREVAAQRRVNVLAVGPGLSVDSETVRFVRKLVLGASVPVVLDADGLNAFRGAASLLKRAKSNLVLTPHPREFERLFGVRCPEGASGRLRLAKQTVGRYHGVGFKY